jgi:hypothetical protein
MDFNKITDVQIEGIDMTDYPDFCDAYINADNRFVHEQVYKELW